MEELILEAAELFKNDKKLTPAIALQQAYESHTDDVWTEIDVDLSFSDSVPCKTKECWCSNNIERATNVPFYRNNFNNDCIVCTVCLDNRLEPDFEHVFSGKILEDAICKIKF